MSHSNSDDDDDRNELLEEMEQRKSQGSLYVFSLNLMTQALPALSSGEATGLDPAPGNFRHVLEKRIQT